MPDFLSAFLAFSLIAGVLLFSFLTFCFAAEGVVEGWGRVLHTLLTSAPA